MRDAGFGGKKCNVSQPLTHRHQFRFSAGQMVGSLYGRQVHSPQLTQPRNLAGSQRIDSWPTARTAVDSDIRVDKFQCLWQREGVSSHHCTVRFQAAGPQRQPRTFRSSSFGWRLNSCVGSVPVSPQFSRLLRWPNNVGVSQRLCKARCLCLMTARHA